MRFQDVHVGLTRTRRHVALLKIQGKEFELTPIPLRSVRPFVIDEIDLSEAAEEHGFDLNDKIEISKFLKNRVRHSFSRLCHRSPALTHIRR